MLVRLLVLVTLVLAQDRMPSMEHTVDMMSYTCGDITQAKQFYFVSPGKSSPSIC